MMLFDYTEAELLSGGRGVLREDLQWGNDLEQ